MPIFAVALALAALHAPPRPVFMAVLAESSSSFASMAECEATLSPSAGRVKKGATHRGSLFNRNAGNISRCEMVDREPVVVVVPRPFANRRR